MTETCSVLITHWMKCVKFMSCWTVTYCLSVDNTTRHFPWRYQGPDWCWFWESKNTTKIHNGETCETFNVTTVGTHTYRCVSKR